jgi:serine/threonine-protein kinase RsbT
MAGLDDLQVPLYIMVHVDAQALVASQMGYKLAARLEYSEAGQTALGTAILEIARNIVRHAGPGEISLDVVRADGRLGIQVLALDAGPGIPDIEQALGDGYTTANGLGLGLPGARRLMDTFELSSLPGQGTTVRMIKWKT